MYSYWWIHMFIDGIVSIKLHHRLFANCVSLNKSCQVSYKMKYSEESSSRKMATLNYKEDLKILWPIKFYYFALLIIAARLAAC